MKSIHRVHKEFRSPNSLARSRRSDSGRCIGPQAFRVLAGKTKSGQPDCLFANRKQRHL